MRPPLHAFGAPLSRPMSMRSLWPRRSPSLSSVLSAKNCLIVPLLCQKLIAVSSRLVISSWRNQSSTAVLYIWYPVFTKPLICAKETLPIGPRRRTLAEFMSVSTEKLKTKVSRSARRLRRSMLQHRSERSTSEKQEGETKDGLAPSVFLMRTAREKNHVYALGFLSTAGPLSSLLRAFGGREPCAPAKQSTILCQSWIQVQTAT